MKSKDAQNCNSPKSVYIGSIFYGTLMWRHFGHYCWNQFVGCCRT